MSNAEAIVREFCTIVSKRDVELVRPLLGDDVVYHNVGMEPSNGLADVLANLEGQWAMFDVYEFDVLNLSVSDDVVLTERVDTIGSNGARWPLPVMGTFVVADGKITAWRDYFDSALIGKLMAGEDVSSLVP
jgi:limonene-1,2-epoxide hydrolase